MATKHTTLLWLPDALKDAGIPFRVLSGWDTNKQGYYWTGADNLHHGYYGDPNGHILHHTATSEYTANVKNSLGQTKANVYAGLGRSGTTRMYSTGDGSPRLDIASGGPANYGNGAGHRKVLSDYVAVDERFPGPLRTFDSDAADNYYANRYFIGTEIIHLGDGTELHPGVFEMVSRFAAILETHYGWDERHVGHEDSTRRKVDPRFKQGAPYTMSAFRSRIVELKDGGEPPPEEEQMLKRGDTGKTVTHYQERLMDWRSTALPVSGADGDYGAETEQWVGSFQTTEDLEKTGTVDGLTAARLDSFALDLVDVKLRRDLVAVQKESNAADAAHAETPHGDEEHTHPQYALDGHTHPGLAIVTHTHPFTGNTEGPTQP